MGLALFILGFILIAAAFPVPGLPGVALAVAGIVALWTGYFLMRKDGFR